MTQLSPAEKRATFIPFVGTSEISFKFAAFSPVKVRQTRHKCGNNIRSRTDMFELHDFLTKLKAVVRYLFVSCSTCQTNEERGGGDSLCVAC